MLAVFQEDVFAFYLCEGRSVCWLYCVLRKACFTCVKERCVLAVMCTQEGVFACVKEKCVLAVMYTQEGVFYLYEGEVCVGCTVYPGRRVLPV